MQIIGIIIITIFVCYPRGSSTHTGQREVSGQKPTRETAKPQEDHCPNKEWTNAELFLQLLESLGWGVSFWDEKHALTGHGHGCRLSIA